MLVFQTVVKAGFLVSFSKDNGLSRFKLSQACRRIGQKNTKKGTVLAGGEVILLVACAEQAMKPFTIMNQSTLINWIVSRFLIATTFLSAPALLAATETLDDPKDSKSVPPAEIKPWCEPPAVRNPHRCSWVDFGCVRWIVE